VRNEEGLDEEGPFTPNTSPSDIGDNPRIPPARNPLYHLTPHPPTTEVGPVANELEVGVDGDYDDIIKMPSDDDDVFMMAPIARRRSLPPPENTSGDSGSGSGGGSGSGSGSGSRSASGSSSGNTFGDASDAPSGDRSPNERRRESSDF